MTPAEERAIARNAARAETARRWTAIWHAVLAGTCPADATPDDFDWTAEDPHVIEIESQLRFRAFCTRCRGVTRWYESALQARQRLDGHHCDPNYPNLGLAIDIPAEDLNVAFT